MGKYKRHRFSAEREFAILHLLLNEGYSSVEVAIILNMKINDIYRVKGAWPLFFWNFNK